MSRSRRSQQTAWLWFATAILLLSQKSAADPPGPGEGRRLEFDDVGVIQTVALTFAANSNYRIWTQETTTADDPVVHLRAQELQSPYSWYHVLSNDDHGSPTGTCTVVPVPSRMTSLDSCLEYDNAAGSSQQASVILRAYRKQYGGTTRLRVKNLTTDTMVYDQFLAFQGEALDTFYDSTDVVWDANDRFDFAYKAQGLLFPHLVVLRGSEDLVAISTKNGSGQTHLGLWGQPQLQLTSGSGSTGPGKGNHSVLLGNMFPDLGLGNGSARVYRNDVVLGDTDEDGLGDDLEDYLGTDPEDVDTDHDGFTDAIETIGGAHHPECTGSVAEWGPTATDPSLGCAINLGTFGADPMIPNIFVTVAWMRTPLDDDPLENTMEDALTDIVGSFVASAGAFENTKPVFDLLVDYGQAELGPFAVGGPVLEYQETMCQHNTRNVVACPNLPEQPSCQTDTNCLGLPEPYCVDGHCAKFPCKNDVCEAYDAEVTGPGGFNPHAPWNVMDMVWGEEPLFPVNRRGLSIPYLIYYMEGPDSFGTVTGGGFCDCLSCEDDAHPNARRIYPGILLSRMELLETSNSGYIARHIMHELGHALHLDHSPNLVAWNYAPNHTSIMNYSFGNAPGNQFPLDYGKLRDPLVSLGEGIEAATTENQCCCGVSPCVADYSSEVIPFDCCPTCGEMSEIDDQCHKCPATWFVPGQFCVIDGQPALGVAQAECCCGDSPCDTEEVVTAPHWCILTAELDPVSDTCKKCNATWHEDACYYGGLDERAGIGGNTNATLHAMVVHLISCLDQNILSTSEWEVDTVGDVDGAPWNIDWNGTSEIPESENPADLAFRRLAFCPAGGADSPLDSLTTIDEWGAIYDLLAVPNHGTQGLGMPAFCDAFQDLSCPVGTECQCGWCVAEQDTLPPSCGILYGGPVCIE